MSTRIVALLIALVPAASLATAQTRPGQPATAAAPALESAAYYAALPEAERQAIQNDLIWTGDYNGVVNATLNARALAAVKAFQKRLKMPETGTLDPKGRAALASGATAKRDAVGWRLQDNGASGARLGIPAKLLPQHTTIIGGSRWTSPRGDVQVETFRVAQPGTTLQGVYDEQVKAAGRKVTYKLMRPDSFVLSGTQGPKKFYVRGAVKDREVRGFTILYDPAQAATIDPIVIAASGAYSAFPTAVAAPPARRKVEYGTGVIVSAKGDVITTRELLETCQSVTLAGLGPADTIARDKASGLALLRVYGTRKLAPLALADSSAAQDVTLVGIADPQSQNGGDKVTTANARIQATSTAARPSVEPAPQIGFAGAAALDRDGRLAGIVDPAPQVIAGPTAAASGTTKLIPIDALRGFLDGQHVLPEAAPPMGMDAAKTAIVRVICVRK